MEELGILFGVLIVLGLLLTPLLLLIQTMGRTRSLERKVAEMSRQIKSLQSLLGAGEGAPPAAAARSARSAATDFDLALLKAEAGAPQPATPEQTSEAPQPVSAAPPDSPLGGAPDASTAPTKSPPPFEREYRRPKAATARSKEEWEMFVGGKVLNRIGALALILAIGFFLKYAFDANLIPEWLRVALGALAGGALLLGASRAQKRGLEVFAQGLVGAGVATLYLSVYAAYNFYRLIPQPLAFVLMIGCTTIGFLQALRYNAFAIAVLSWAGGFLTPLMLPTQDINSVGLFSYVAFLDVGMLALVFVRDDWFALKPMSYAATWLMAWGWYDAVYNNGNYFSVAVFFSTTFWALFFATDVYRAISGAAASDAWWRKIESGFNSVVYYGVLYALVSPFYPASMPWITLAYGGVYTASATLLRRRQPESLFIFSRYVVSAVVALAGATALYFEPHNAVTAWALEAVGLVWLGARLHIPIARYLALGLLAWATLDFFGIEELFKSAPYAPFWHRRSVPFAALIAAAAASAALYQRAEDSLKAQIVAALHAAWLGLWGLAVTIEIGLFFDAQRPLLRFAELEYKKHLAFGAWWAVLALGAAWLGGRLQQRALLYCGLGVMAVSVLLSLLLGFSYHPLDAYAPLLNARGGEAIFVCAVAAALLLALKRSPFLFPHLRYAPAVVGAFALALLFSLLTGETSDFFLRDIESVWKNEAQNSSAKLAESARLHDIRQMAISLVWLLYAIALMIVGFARKTRELRLASIALSGISILKIFLYDLSFLQTLYRIFSFMGLGALLLLVSYLYQRYKDVLFGAPQENKNERDTSP